MTVMICRDCGGRVVLRSSFDACCTECGSEDLEAEDAYDPVERELQCQFCGYTVDTSAGPDKDWASDAPRDTPTSVDDPCPICASALVPRSEARTVRGLPEYKLAREAARKLHRDHDIPGPPFSLEHLAEELGLTIEVRGFDHDGLLVGTRIQLPSTTSEKAMRFALAHEIGHFVLRHEGDRVKVEPEANAFASELVVPRDLLRAAISRTPAVRALSAQFGVSRQAMVYALMAAKAIGRVQA
jgi:IrrE N-terminal-like domain